MARLKIPVNQPRVDSPPPRTPTEKVAFLIATCGVGLIPVAPGTWGSAVGVGCFWLLNYFSGKIYAFAMAHNLRFASEMSFRTSLLLVATAAVTFVGIWAATSVEHRSRLKDPGIVVIDEVAGQMLTFIFIPFSAGPWTILVGFVAFRLFDIWKPYPIRKLEVLDSGLGIMADDILAGLYAAILLSLLGTARLLT